ncbi:MAG TPA: alpha/beta fold hydrolase [Gemmatimonadaceae bacterium]|nr:alpha/beta fold hydrolase [Gemmatimonadaceae bacterium]
MDTLQRQLYPLLTIAALAFTYTAAFAQAPAIHFAPFSFKGTETAQVDADSGTLVVRADRRSANRATITLPIVRFRSTSQVKAAPIVYVSGGAGSGIAAARGARFPFFMALRDVGDVITLDLRGAGRSQPRVSCGFGFPDLSAPMTYAAIVSVLQGQTRTCADSLRKTGAILEGHNLREVVADLDELRAALGVKRISLVGISTGTQIVLEYVRRHPGNVERVVLAGVQAPDQNHHMPAGEDAVVQALSAKLSSAGGETLVSQITRVLDSVTARPRQVSIVTGRGDTTAIGIGRFDVQLLVAATLGDRRQMSLLPQLIGAAARGNYSPLASMKAAAARQGITSAYEALMDCQTSAPAPRLARAYEQAKTALLGNATLDFPEVCAAWGVSPLDNSYRQPVSSRVAALLISGTLDGRTPVHNAEDAMSHLPNAMHLILDGASHGDDLFLSSPEVVPTIVKFLSGTSGLPRQRHLVVR